MYPVGVNTEMLFSQVLSLEMGNLGYESESAEQCVGISPGRCSPPFLFDFIFGNVLQACFKLVGVVVWF